MVSKSIGVQDAGRMQVGCRIQDAERRIHDTGYGNLNYNSQGFTLGSSMMLILEKEERKEEREEKRKKRKEKRRKERRKGGRKG